MWHSPRKVSWRQNKCLKHRCPTTFLEEPLTNHGNQTSKTSAWWPLLLEVGAPTCEWERFRLDLNTSEHKTRLCPFEQPVSMGNVSVWSLSFRNSCKHNHNNIKNKEQEKEEATTTTKKKQQQPYKHLGNAKSWKTKFQSTARSFPVCLGDMVWTAGWHHICWEVGFGDHKKHWSALSTMGHVPNYINMRNACSNCNVKPLEHENMKWINKQHVPHYITTIMHAYQPFQKEVNIWS